MPYSVLPEAAVFPAAEVIADDTARRRAVGMIQNELESQLALFKKAKEPDLCLAAFIPSSR